MSLNPYRFIGNLWLVSKVLLASTLVSIGIRTLGPRLAIPATPSVALLMVMLPTVIMAGALGFQYYRQRSQVG